MKEDFIEWPDYAICPNCKKKIDIKKKLNIFQSSSEIRKVTCPYCKTELSHVERKSIESPFSGYP